MESKKEGLKKIFLYGILGIVIIATCIISALFAIKLQRQNVIEEEVITQTLRAHDAVVDIILPFKVEPDEGFRVDQDIQYYVKSTKAFFGQDENLALHIYSVTYRTELFLDSWEPNVEGMAQVSISSLEKNKSFDKFSHEVKELTVSDIKAVEVTSRYRRGTYNMVQRVLHIPTKTSTWSFKAVYREKDETKYLFDLITKIFESIKLKAE